MPSKSAKQHKLMQAAAHNPQFAKKAGIPVSVAKEFNQADKGKKFKGGGMAKKPIKSKVKKFKDGGSTKLYEVPGKSKYGASEAALTRQAEKNIDSPSRLQNVKDRASALLMEAAGASPFALDKQKQSSPVYDTEARIAARQAKYEKDIADREAAKEALRNKKEVSNYNTLSEYNYRSGGKVTNMKKLFKGKESYSEELKEGKAIKSGKITPEQYAKGEEMEKKMKKGSKCMAGGGDTAGNERLAADMVKKARSSGTASPAPVTKARGGKCMATGGSASSRADGCATKGKTKGRII